MADQPRRIRQINGTGSTNTQLEGGLCANERSQSNKAQVEAIVSEVAKLYEDGQLNQRSSYDENFSPI